MNGLAAIYALAMLLANAFKIPVGTVEECEPHKVLGSKLVGHAVKASTHGRFDYSLPIACQL